jgi:hypothetical protein
MVVERLVAGRFADLIDFFTPRLREVLSADEISGGWAVMREMHGDVGAVGSPACSTADSGAVMVRVPLTCEHGGFVVAVSIDAEDGRLAGLRMVSDDAAPTTSPWVPASYVDRESFTERHVTIGTGPLRCRVPQPCHDVLHGHAPLCCWVGLGHQTATARCARTSR